MAPFTRAKITVLLVGDLVLVIFVLWYLARGLRLTCNLHENKREKMKKCRESTRIFENLSGSMQEGPGSPKNALENQNAEGKSQTYKNIWNIPGDCFGEIFPGCLTLFFSYICGLGPLPRPLHRKVNIDKANLSHPCNKKCQVVTIFAAFPAHII